MLMTLGNFLKNFLPQPGAQLVHNDAPRRRPPLQPLGLDEFLNLSIPPRQMLLSPILPERSLAMLYARAEFCMSTARCHWCRCKNG